MSLPRNFPSVGASCKSPKKFVLPNCLWQKQSRNYRAVFETLWSDADDTGELTLDAGAIAGQCGCSRQTLYRIIRYLESVIIRRRGLNRPILERVEARTGRGNHSVYRLNWKAIAPRMEKTVTPPNHYREKGHQRRGKSDWRQSAPRAKAPNDETIMERLHLSETLPERKARNCLAMCVRWKAWQMRWAKEWQQALTQAFTRYTRHQPLWQVRELAWRVFHNLCADWSRRLKRWLGWLRANYSLSESAKALHAYLRTLFTSLDEPTEESEMDSTEVLRMALRGLLGREPTEEEIAARVDTDATIC